MKDVNEKRCTKCGVIKPTEEFHKHHGGIGVVRPDCKSCKIRLVRQYELEIKSGMRMVHRPIDPVKAKKCSRCRIEKPVSEYYVRRDRTNGRKSECIECVLLRGRRYQDERRLNGVKISRRYRFYNRERLRTEGILYRQRYPDRLKANNAINNSIRSGLIVKPNRCELCGDHCRPDGHHEDYKQPLSVIWLCRRCHRSKQMPWKMEVLACLRDLHR